MLGGFPQHRRGDVARNDVRDVRCKGQRRMPGTGRHVEDPPVCPWRNERDEAGKAWAPRMHGGGSIVGRRSTELLLNERSGHRRSFF
jgi:hypothetical protein